MQTAVREKGIGVIWNANVSKYLTSEQGLTGIEITFKDGHSEVKNLDGLFLSIGNIPNVDFLNGMLELADGHIKVNGFFMASIPGIFAAGDVIDSLYKQVVVAAGQGAAATISASRFLSDH
jgi:thioredoxin reductase (NADPH)